MNPTIFTIILTSLLFSPSSSDFDYCQLKCNANKHTMCLYKGVSDQCEKYKKADVNEAAKKLLVDKHNEMRRCIAKGIKYKPNHPEMPKAANMMKFQWHEESAKVAQRWADQCKYQHDACRKLQDMDNGQNIYRKFSTNPMLEVPYVKFLDGFYSEIMLFNVSHVDKFVPVEDVSHFTQQIWAKTQYIGCGASFHQVKVEKSAAKNYVFLVCNYGPRGNVISMPIYKRGEPCSACPSGTICEDGLCAIPVILHPGVDYTQKQCSACPKGTICEDGVCTSPKTTPSALGGTQKPCPACSNGTNCGDGICTTPGLGSTQKPCSGCSNDTTCQDGICAKSQTPLPDLGGTTNIVPQMSLVMLAPVVYYFIFNLNYCN